jgi:hypothetical protein
MNGIVVAAIAPHGGIAVSELCDDADLDVAALTRAGLEEVDASRRPRRTRSSS